MEIDKDALLTAFVAQLQARLEQTRAIAAHAAASATHDEARAEDKYDTRGLELTYLAAGTNDRAQALRRVIDQYRLWSLPDPATTWVTPGSLVELVDDDDNTLLLFIAPFGDGAKIEVDGTVAQVVTLRAPLGKALARREEGDEVKVLVAGQTHIWTIKALC